MIGTLESFGVFWAFAASDSCLRGHGFQVAGRRCKITVLQAGNKCVVKNM